jgi:hypothetical protein
MPFHTVTFLRPGIPLVVTGMFDHSTHVTFCITHLFLFETTLHPFAPVLYVRATAKKRGVPVEENH